MSLRKIGTAEPAPVEVEGVPEDMTRTARREWTDEDARALAKENEDDPA